MNENRERIIVGVDGLPESDRAITWAMAEANLRHLPLELVCAYTWAVTLGMADIYAVEPEVQLKDMRRAADRVIEEAQRRVRDEAPELEVTAVAEEGDPVSVLLKRLAGARMLVLGSRQLHAAGSFLLGSIGSELAARSTCPTVVTRGPAAPAEPAGRVVVGVDATPDSAALLAFGFDEASRRGTGLHAVLCSDPSVFSPARWSPAAALRAHERAEVWLSECRVGWQEKFPDVDVSQEVVTDHPVQGLVTASPTACMLVIGTHGGSATVGSLLGSTCQGVLHHAVCPVAVVPLR